jgi:flagellar assembly protein FliH
MEISSIKIPHPITHLFYDGEEYSIQKSNPDDTDVVLGDEMSSEDQVEILEKALEQTRETAYQAGFQEGRELAKSDLNERVKELSSDFTQMLSGLNNEYENRLNSIEDSLIDISVRIAKKILGHELNHEKNIADYLSKRLKDVLLRLMDQSKINIYLNPDWLKEMNQEKFLEQISFPIKHKIQFHKNDRLLPGECKIESEEFFIDATLDHQLNILTKHLKQEYMKWN